MEIFGGRKILRMTQNVAAFVLVICCYFVPIVDLVRLSTPNGTVLIQELEDIQNWPVLDNNVLGSSLLLGDETNESNYFKVLLKDDGTIFFGSRNSVFIVNLDKPSKQEVIRWNSSAIDLYRCQARQNSQDYCHNFIRVAAQTSHNDLMLCGTNSQKPHCRIYSRGLDGYTKTDEMNGVGRCPYTPAHSSTAFYAEGRLYAATVADPSARDALLFKEPMMRTEQHDSQWLNDPRFVNFQEYGDKMYLFFREPAVENINCKKVIFSRVARVCKNDQGGSRVLKDTWTSFFKARLNCSIPGEFPFYFDELQSMSEIGDGNIIPSVGSNERQKIVYGVFSTAQNSLQGTAVCAFKMQDIEKVFAGSFKEQKNARSSWLPVKESDTPNPHPAKSCANDSLSLSDQTLNFIKSHPLMDKSVNSWSGKPIFTLTTFKFTFVSIAVDWQVPAADGKYYDVIFLGTDDGRVVKYVNLQKSGDTEAVVLADMQLFPTDQRVKEISIHRDRNTLLAVTENSVRSLPLQRCNSSTTCSSCVALRDPYCSWSETQGCHASGAGLINIDAGHHSNCAIEKSSTSFVTPQHVRGEIVPSDYSTTTKAANCDVCMQQCGRIDETPREGASCDSKVVRGSISGGVLCAAVLCSVIVTLVVGFIAGYKFSLWRNKTSAYQCGSHENNKVKVVNEYDLEPPNHLRYSKPRNEDVPSSPIQPKEKQLNVDFKFNALGGKTLNSNVETTIQREPAKVKKVYI